MGKVAGPGLGTVGDIARHTTDLNLIINKYMLLEEVAGPGLSTVGYIARHATNLNLIINKYVIRGGHRQIIQLDGKREGADASSVKLNLTFHCCTVPWLRDARPAGWIKCCSICASTLPKS